MIRTESDRIQCSTNIIRRCIYAHIQRLIKKGVIMQTILLRTALALGCIGSLYAENSMHQPYPIASPRTQGHLAVSSKHSIFYALYGNPDGLPVLIVHGGPGQGCSDAESRFFDLERFNIIMFDQRGAMRSEPFACMDENTTQHSIEDMEMLRKHLGIKQWIVFGASWGSLLSILYGQAHPESCLGFILGGIFLGRDQDVRLIGDKDEAPEAYQEFMSHIPEPERYDVLAACYKMMMHEDPAVHIKIARAMMRYHMIRTSHQPPSAEKLESVLNNDRFLVSFMRAVSHYAVHKLFIQPNQVIDNMYRIAHLPAHIIHGNKDKNCSPEQAVTLHEHWHNSKLHIVENVGHSYDDALVSVIINATCEFAENFGQDKCLIKNFDVLECVNPFFS